MTSKVIGIESGKKPEEPCPFCGAIPACQGWTCQRLSAVEIWPDGGHRVEFVCSRNDEPDEAA